jgi:ribosome-binding factor A
VSSHRIDRVSEDIKRELCDIFRSLKDPRISQFLSVVRVDVSGDLSYASVYVSALEGADAAKNSVKGLTSAKGYIKRELSSRIKLRKVPELRFIADDSIQHGAHISQILNDIKDV